MTRALAACTALVLMISGSALAAPGEHILVGEAVIIPKVDLGVEYRTNPYHQEDGSLGVANARLAPGIEITAKGPQTDFQIGGEVEFRYTLVGAESQRANLDRYGDFNVVSSLHLLTDQVVQVQISEMAGLRNNVASTGQALNPFHTQFRNDLGLLIPIRVGPAIEISPGGSWAFDDFQLPESGRNNGNFRPFNSRNTMSGHLNAKWTFFPRTAAVFEASYEKNLWQHEVVSISDSQAGNPFGDSIYLPNSDFVKVTGGIRGRFTKRLVLIVTGGYGIGIYDKSNNGAGEELDVSNIDRMLLLIQAKYELAPGNRLSIGFRKDFEDSWFANYVAYNYVYGRLDNRFGPRFGSTLEAGVRYESYVGQVSRNDSLLNIKGDVSFYATDWLSFSTGAWWTNRVSATDTSLNYSDVNIHLLTNFTY